MIRTANENLLELAAAGRITPREVRTRWREQIPRILGKGSMSFAQRFKQKYGLTRTTSHVSKKELDYTDPRMVAIRDEVKILIGESVPELVANIDEMWRRQLRDQQQMKGLTIRKGHEVDISKAGPI